MQDLRESIGIKVGKSEEKYRQEILGRSYEVGKVISGHIPPHREKNGGSSLIVRVEVEMEIQLIHLDILPPP